MERKNLTYTISGNGTTVELTRKELFLILYGIEEIKNANLASNEVCENLIAKLEDVYDA